MTTSVYELLKCPVCGLGGETDAEKKRFYCHGQKQHSFDFAKSGYLNLCLTAKAGDLKEAVRSRSAFLEEGHYLSLSNEINSILSDLNIQSVLDAGCGEGYYTNRMAQVAKTVFGADLSKFGVEKGAKTAKSLGANAFFAVASIFELPVKDASFDAVTNIFAPCCESEFLRVLKPGGHLILVGAGERHLMGLKKVLYDTQYLNPERNDLPKEMTLVEKRTLRTTISVKGNDMIRALFSMTPYYWRTSPSDSQKLDGLDVLETELDFDIYIYRKDL